MLCLSLLCALSKLPFTFQMVAMVLIENYFDVGKRA